MNSSTLNYRLLADKWTSLNLNLLIEKAIEELKQADSKEKYTNSESLTAFIIEYQNFFDEIIRHPVISVLGTNPISLLEDIIPARNFDISFTHLILKQKILALDTIYERMKKIMITTEELCHDFMTKEITDNFYPQWKEGILGIIYSDKVIPPDLYSKEKFFRLWNTIIDSFNQLTKSQIRAEIYQMDCYSNIIKLEPVTIQTLIEGLRIVLEDYKKILEIKKIKLEIEQLNLNAKDTLLEMLNNEINTEIDTICKSVAENLIIPFNHPTSDSITIIDNIQIALKQLINFIEKGGNLISSQSLLLNELVNKINTIITNTSLIKPYSNFWETTNSD